MEMDNYIGIITEEMTRWYNILNKDKFGGSLLPVVITVMKARRNNLGHFTTGRVWVNKNDPTDKRYEINVAAHSLHRDVKDIVVTMLHEMGHEKNLINGINDCNGSVHNKKFRDLAESLGMRVERSERGGWGHTYLTDELEAYIDEHIQPNDDLFKYARITTEEAAQVAPPKKPRNKTIFVHACPNCDATAKAKKDVTLKCGACDVVMVVQED